MNERITRLEDLARIAGVSTATVSRALNDSPAVTAYTKRHIWKLAREHHYPFRHYMPSGPIGAEATIVVVITRPQGRPYRLSDPFILELVAGIGEAARERGCDFLVSHVAPASYEDLTALMTTNRADGVIFLGQSSLFADFNRLAEENNRFVVWGAELPGQSYSSVGSDNWRGGKRATSHLIRLNRRRILFLGDIEAPEVMQRYRGYTDALGEAGFEVEPELVVPAHFEVEFAEAAIDSLIAKGVQFDGVFAASDLIALGAIRSLQHAGLRVPADVSVVGYDDISFARYSQPALTTISQDTAKAGRLLVSKLLTSGQDMPSERLPTDLIVRESCGG